MRSIVSTIVIVASVASTASSQPPTPAKQAGTTKPQPTPIRIGPSTGERAFSSVPFSRDVSVLPPGYRGHSLRDLFLKMLPPEPKGEFETTAQFQARVAKAVAPAGVYAFILDNELAGPRVQYDADAQRFEIKVLEDFGVIRGNKRDASVRAITVNRSRRERSYEAGNAFGAKVDVTEVAYTSYGLVIDGPPPGIGPEREHVFSVPVPVSEAQKVKGGLSVLFVCEPHPAAFPATFGGSETTGAPTIATPFQSTTDYSYVRVQLLDVWVFDRNTGRVYLRGIQF